MGEREFWSGRLLWQSALLAPVLLVIAVGGAFVWYWAEWWGPPRWHEAWRHDTRIFVAMDRWVHFRWIHPDAEYWILPVDFADGPITLRGTPPDGVYWSVTWYEGTVAHPSVGSENVVLEPDGTYQVSMSNDPTGPNSIPVTDDAGTGVIYLRVYEPPPGSVMLPEVRQNGELVKVGGRR